MMTANRIFAIFNLLLITAGIYLGVNAFYSIMTARMDYGAPGQTLPGDKPPQASPDAASPRSIYQAIVDRNLFNTSAQGDGANEPEQTDLELDKLEETKLGLKLWGTVSGIGEQAYAVIEDTKTRRQSLYHPGDSILNATVKLVLRQKVVLTVDGRDEILAMEEPGTAGGGTQAGVRRASVPQPELAQAPKLPVSDYPRQIEIKSEQIEQAMQNLGDLMSQATFMPHIENGQPAGISITRIKPNAIFRRLRLRNGDIITAVNGSPIASVEDAVRVFEGLSENPNVQLEIKRRGRQQTLEYRID